MCDWMIRVDCIDWIIETGFVCNRLSWMHWANMIQIRWRREARSLICRTRNIHSYTHTLTRKDFLAVPLCATRRQFVHGMMFYCAPVCGLRIMFHEFSRSIDDASYVITLATPHVCFVTYIAHNENIVRSFIRSLVRYQIAAHHFIYIEKENIHRHKTATHKHTCRDEWRLVATARILCARELIVRFVCWAYKMLAYIVRANRLVANQSVIEYMANSVDDSFGWWRPNNNQYYSMKMHIK